MTRINLQRYLDDNQVKYLIVEHSPAYAALDVASSAHIAEWELAKAVIVKMDGRMAMVVLPASERIDLDALASTARAAQVKIALEDEFKDRFPDCEPGAMPPFGNLYDMEVFTDESLAGSDLIAFNAGDHRTLIRMHYADFLRLTNPKMGHFTAVTATAL